MTRNFNECISNHFGCLDFFPSAPLVQIRYEFNFSFLFTVRNFTNTFSPYGTLPLHEAAYRHTTPHTHCHRVLRCCCCFEHFFVSGKRHCTETSPHYQNSGWREMFLSLGNPKREKCNRERQTSDFSLDLISLGVPLWFFHHTYALRNHLIYWC